MAGSLAAAAATVEKVAARVARVETVARAGTVVAGGGRAACADDAGDAGGESAGGAGGGREGRDRGDCDRGLLRFRLPSSCDLWCTVVMTGCESVWVRGYGPTVGAG